MLDAGECIIGDGGYTYALERRGYMTPGEWTPECVVEYPEAGRKYLNLSAQCTFPQISNLQDNRLSCF